MEVRLYLTYSRRMSQYRVGYFMCAILDILFGGQKSDKLYLNS